MLAFLLHDGFVLQDSTSVFISEPLSVSSWSYPASGVRPDVPSLVSQERTSLLLSSPALKEMAMAVLN